MNNEHRSLYSFDIRCPVFNLRYSHLKILKKKYSYARNHAYYPGSITRHVHWWNCVYSHFQGYFQKGKVSFAAILSVSTVYRATSYPFNRQVDCINSGVVAILNPHKFSYNMKK